MSLVVAYYRHSSFIAVHAGEEQTVACQPQYTLLSVAQNQLLCCLLTFTAAMHRSLSFTSNTFATRLAQSRLLHTPPYSCCAKAIGLWARRLLFLIVAQCRKVSLLVAHCRYRCHNQQCASARSETLVLLPLYDECGISPSIGTYMSPSVARYFFVN